MSKSFLRLAFIRKVRGEVHVGSRDERLHLRFASKCQSSSHETLSIRLSGFFILWTQ